MGVPYFSISGVRRKAPKTIDSTSFPVGEDFERVVVEWVRYLQSEKQFGRKRSLRPTFN
jgi:hypothetical protein